MSTDSTRSDQVDRLTLEFEHLRHQNEKLALEIKTLRATSPTSAWEGRLTRFIPVVTAVVAAGGLWFGVVQYFRAEDAALAQRIEADKTLRLDLKRETAKPLWGSQLALYLEAAEVAATIATTADDDARNQAEARFWVLYWGPLAAVEDVGLTKSVSADIEAAMVGFGNHLSKPPSERDSSALKNASLSVAHAIREALAPAFDVQKADLQNLRPTN